MTHNSTVRASVIIPVYNDSDRLKKCLDALSEQTMPRDEFEVIVVDNGSEEPPRELVESYPFCRYAEESKPGSYAARNRGLQLAAGEVLAFTDADCVPSPGWLAAGVRRVEDATSPGRAGGRIVVIPEDSSRPTSAELYDVLFGLDQLGNVENYNFAATANSFAGRRVFDEVGCFNGELKSLGDFDWGQRAQESGYSIVWSEEAIVAHPARRRVKELIVQTRRHSGGRMDRRRERSRSRSLFSDLLVVVRLLLPPLKKFREITRRLRADGYAWTRVPGVCGIAWVIRLNVLYSSGMALLGATTERR